jgi:hypothetical protein
MISLKGIVAAAAVCVVGSAAIAQDVAFELNNKTSFDVEYIYTSAGNDSDWGEDILGADVLESGYSTTIYIFDDGDQCEYDILFVFDDGDEIIDEIDICEMESYTIN